MGRTCRGNLKKCYSRGVIDCINREEDATTTYDTIMICNDEKNDCLKFTANATVLYFFCGVRQLG